MKKMIMLMLLITSLSIPFQVQAKTILVPMEKCTDEYVERHNKDTIIVYVYGTCINKNGDGVDKKGYYINYPKGKIGVKYTSLFIFNNNPKGCDDFDIRIDHLGWRKPRLN